MDIILYNYILYIRVDQQSTLSVLDYNNIKDWRTLINVKALLL